MTDRLTLYDRAGGTPFFEALVGRFYAGVAEDPILLAIYPETDLAAAQHRLTLFLIQYWGGRLVGYLAAIGIGIAAYGLILTLTGMDPFGATSKLPSDRAWAEGLGLLIWMIGLWLVAARYAFKAIRPIKPNPAAISYRPMAAAAI